MRKEETTSQTPLDYNLEDIKIEGFDVSVGEGLEQGSETIEEEEGAANGLVSKEQFQGGIKLAFQISGNFTGLNSLSIKEGEEDSLRAASDSIYDICEETSFLRFLIQPDNVWLQRAICIAAFAMPKYNSVRLEIAERKVAAMQAKKEKEQPEEKEEGQEPEADQMSAINAVN